MHLHNYLYLPFIGFVLRLKYISLSYHLVLYEYEKLLRSCDKQETFRFQLTAVPNKF